jgi:hypothetical protein
MHSLSRFPVLLGLLALSLLPACYRVEYRSTITVPPALVGAWNGTWRSAMGGGQGTMALRLQTFDERPVLHVDTSHACLQGGAFQLSLRGTHFEVRRGGVPVFTAELEPDARRLVGDYACAADHGTWNVEWTRELPPLGDVTGDWTGTFATAQPPVDLDFALRLEQTWDDGNIVVNGEVHLEGQPQPLSITQGRVFHVDQGFDLVLSSIVGSTRFVVQGAGHFGDPVSASGLAFVDTLGGPQFAGAWTAERLPP